MKILVSGAGGYIGMRLCPALAAAGHDVTAFDRYFFGRKPERARVVAGDIRTAESSLFAGIECVVDLAGLSNDAAGDIDPRLTIEINAEGGLRFAGRARRAGVRRYIYSSSASVYGHGRKASLTEEDETAPLTEYAKGKLWMERALLSMGGDGFEPTILRNATVYGLSPRMRFDLAVNVMVARARKMGVIYVMGGGQQQRPFVHILDVVDTIKSAVMAGAHEVNGQIFNVGSNDQNFKISELAHIVAARVRPASEIYNIPDQPDDRSYHLAFDKMNAVFGPCERKISAGIDEVSEAVGLGMVSLDDLTTNTLQWYRSLMDWDKRITELKAVDGRLL